MSSSCCIFNFAYNLTWHSSPLPDFNRQRVFEGFPNFCKFWQVESKYNDILVALEEPCALHFEDFSGFPRNNIGASASPYSCSELSYHFPFPNMPRGLHARWWPSHCQELRRTKGRMYTVREIFWDILMRFVFHNHLIILKFCLFWNPRFLKIIEKKKEPGSWQQGGFSLNSFLSSFQQLLSEVRAHFQWMKSRERKAARSSDVRIRKHKWSTPISQAIVMRPSDFLQNKFAFRAKRNESDAILQNLMQKWNWKKPTGHTTE